MSQPNRSHAILQVSICVQRRLSKRVEDSRRPPALRAVSGVARPQGVEGSGTVGPGETLGSPWPPLAG
jgi:hypothetical protein